MKVMLALVDTIRWVEAECDDPTAEYVDIYYKLDGVRYRSSIIQQIPAVPIFVSDMVVYADLDSNRGKDGK